MNDWIYPPQAASSNVFPVLPGGGGGCEPSEWTEITDSMMGALDNTNDERVVSMSHSSASGWAIAWNGASGSTGNRDEPDDMAYRRATLASLGMPADATMLDWSVDVMILTDLTQLGGDSIYDVGFGLAVVSSDFTSGQGLAITTRNATNLNTNYLGGPAWGVGNLHFDDDLIGAALHMRAYQNGSGNYQLRCMAYRWESTAFRSASDWASYNVGTAVFTETAEEATLAIYAVADVGASEVIGSYTQTARLYYRFNPTLRAPTRAEVAALL